MNIYSLRSLFAIADVQGPKSIFGITRYKLTIKILQTKHFRNNNKIYGDEISTSTISRVETVETHRFQWAPTQS